MTGVPGRRHRPRRAPGFVFLLGAGVLLAASLAGGQVWALSGSVPLGVGAGAVAVALLSVACRPLLRVLSAGRRVLGQQRGRIDEDDFVEVVDVVADATPRGRLVRDVQARPEQVADSIRGLLGRSAGERRPRR